ncbi:hypothetical protein F5148DRAFT_1278773 [Russula earlei]|uniref:Uncharacterized protein n=1 Tax=Russula earlei TaxID=71964 RepID=A0ACC0URG5_9AGAM|nr:hypothetical protein F5148DRAFT_1278773 [Russula earlei]
MEVGLQSIRALVESSVGVRFITLTSTSSNYGMPVDNTVKHRCVEDLARLRAEASRSQQTLTHSQSLESQPPPSFTVVTEQGGPTSSSETRRLQTEVESLRREMQQLRTERLEPPSSHTSGGPP